MIHFTLTSRVEAPMDEYLRSKIQSNNPYHTTRVVIFRMLLKKATIQQVATEYFYGSDELRARIDLHLNCFDKAILKEYQKRLLSS